MLLVLLLMYVCCAHLCAIGTEPRLGVIRHLAVIWAVVFAPTRVSRLQQLHSQHITVAAVGDGWGGGAC
eukprot:4657549-Ditylum_brightwellii.AAC.1